MSKLVCIAGGSGSGKSTLAIALCKKYPEHMTLVHLDDYYKKYEDAPRYAKGINWDHPGALRFNDLVRDIKKLLAGKEVSILTKSEWYHGSYSPELRNKIPWTLMPRQILILEGHLALYDARIRKKMDIGIYTDMPIAQSVKRRGSNKVAQSDRYFEQVLHPAHWDFVEPTKFYADLIVDVSTLRAEEVVYLVESYLWHHADLPRE